MRTCARSVSTWRRATWARTSRPGTRNWGQSLTPIPPLRLPAASGSGLSQQGRPRLLADDAVRGQTAGRLEGTHGGIGVRPEDPVSGRRRETTLGKLTLQEFDVLPAIAFSQHREGGRVHFGFVD